MSIDSTPQEQIKALSALLRVYERPVFIGGDPSPKGRPELPLDPLAYNSQGAWLAKLCEMEPEDFIDKTIRLTLFAEPLDGVAWPKALARKIAMQLHASGLLRHRNVVLVGRQVAEAFFPEIDYESLGLVRKTNTHYFFLPTPSGWSTFYKDQNCLDASTKMLRQQVFGDVPMVRELLES